MKSPSSRQCQAGGIPASVQEIEEAAVATDLSGWTANELAVRAQGGCSAAFTELANRYRPRLIRFIDKRVAHQQTVEAEDLAQEVLAKAWHSLERFRPQYQFATWLYTIAVRTAMDHLRRPRRTEASTLLESIPDQQLSHEVRIEVEESVDNIWSIATRVLKDDQYAALWLRYAEDLSVKEIAKVLGKTSVGVRVILHRSRCALQPHLRMYVSEQAKAGDRSLGKDSCSNS